MAAVEKLTPRQLQFLKDLRDGKNPRLGKDGNPPRSSAGLSRMVRKLKERDLVTGYFWGGGINLTERGRTTLRALDPTESKR